MSLPFSCQSRFSREMQRLGNKTHGLTLQQVQIETFVVAEGTGSGHFAPPARAFSFQTETNSATQNNAYSTAPQGFCGRAQWHTRVLCSSPVLFCTFHHPGHPSLPFLILTHLFRGAYYSFVSANLFQFPKRFGFGLERERRSRRAIYFNLICPSVLISRRVCQIEK